MVLYTDPLRAFVTEVLRQPFSRNWTVQGFGMLRTYINGDLVRLSVWDHSLTYNPEPSMIHDHPWDFQSEIIAGRLTNTTYEVHPLGATLEGHFLRFPQKAMMRTIKPGEGLQIHGDDVPVVLGVKSIKEYRAGFHYNQTHDEVHKTEFVDGTVTIVSRDRGNRQDVARTFYSTPEWHQAKPRPATHEEINRVCHSSFDRWFK